MPRSRHVLILVGLLLRLNSVFSASPKRTALIYEDPAFVQRVRASLPPDAPWELVELSNTMGPADLATVEVAIGDVPAALLDVMPRLRLWQGVGYVTPVEYKMCAGGLPFNITAKYPNLSVCRGGSPV